MTDPNRRQTLKAPPPSVRKLTWYLQALITVVQQRAFPIGTAQRTLYFIKGIRNSERHADSHIASPIDWTGRRKLVEENHCCHWIWTQQRQKVHWRFPTPTWYCTPKMYYSLREFTKYQIPSFLHGLPVVFLPCSNTTRAVYITRDLGRSFLGKRRYFSGIEA